MSTRVSVRGSRNPATFYHPEEMLYALRVGLGYYSLYSSLFSKRAFSENTTVRTLIVKFILRKLFDIQGIYRLLFNGAQVD